MLISRGEKTRTSGPYVPNVVRYQLRHTPILLNSNSNPFNFRPLLPNPEYYGLPMEFTTLCVATPRIDRRSLGIGKIPADKNSNFLYNYIYALLTFVRYKFPGSNATLALPQTLTIALPANDLYGFRSRVLFRIPFTQAIWSLTKSAGKGSPCPGKIVVN